MSNQKLQYLVAAFFVVAVAVRFFPHAYNFAPYGALALFAGCYLSAWQGMVLGFGAVAVSDIIGNFFNLPGLGFYTPATMLVVYASSALPGVVGWLTRKLDWKLTTGIGALASAAIFFVFSNFAAWLDPMMQYPQTLAGLMSCYVAAIPFAGGSLLGNLFYACVFFGAHRALATREAAQVPFAANIES